MRRALLALTGLLLLAPTAARADEVTVQAGAVSATLSYTLDDDGRTEGPIRMKVSRGGAVLFDEDLDIPPCADGFCVLERPPPEGTGPIRIRDLDADGEPEVLTSVFTGGAHCCFIDALLTLRPDASAYDLTAHDYAHSGRRIGDIDGDGRPELVSYDSGFAYAFASYAGSGFPVQIWQIDGGEWVDVTGGFRGRVRADARYWWRAYRRSLRGRYGEPLGPLAAWAADEYRLGRRAFALRILRRERRRGRLGPDGIDIWPSGRRFIRELDTLLRRAGYAG